MNVEFDTMHTTKSTNQHISVGSLQHSQYKKDATQQKNYLVLKLPPLFPLRVGDGKKAAILKLRVLTVLQEASKLQSTDSGPRFIHGWI